MPKRIRLQIEKGVSIELSSKHYLRDGEQISILPLGVTVEISGMEQTLAKKHEADLKKRMSEDNSMAEHQAAIDKHPGAPHEKLIHHMATFDPTEGKKKYLPWMVNAYAKGGINKIEDLHRAGNALKLFHKSTPKMKPEDRDINKYKKLSDLETQVEPYDPEHNKAGASKADLTQHYFNKGEATKVHDSPDYSVVIPHTKEASKHFGVNTKWCTTAKDDNQNMFDNYNKKGKLFYVTHKPTNTKHALLMHHNSDTPHELYNSQDEEIGHANLAKIAPEAHKAIMEHVATSRPSLATTHALTTKKGGRWPEAEPAIMKNPKASAFYHHKILKKKPNAEAQKVIDTDPRAQLYSKLAHE